MDIDAHSNMSLSDRMFRGLLGCGLVCLVFLYPSFIDNSLLNLLVGGFGGLNVLSALVGLCPAYSLANYSTLLKVDNHNLSAPKQRPKKKVGLYALTMNNQIDKSVVRKLTMSILLPSLALLLLFSGMLYQLKSEKFLEDVANKGNAVSHMAIGLAALGLDPLSERSSEASELYLAALGTVAALVFHDNAGSVLQAPVQKISADSSLNKKLRAYIAGLNTENNAKTSQMFMHAEKMYVYSTVPHPHDNKWVTTIVPCEVSHALLSTIGTARFLVLVLVVLWLSGWSAAFVIRKYLAKVADISKEMEYRNLHDDLTGLPNRLMVSTVIEQRSHDVSKNGGILSVLMIDLIGFRDINDTLGHKYGDKLLVSIANALKELESETVCVAHMGADVFCIVCNSGNDLTVTYAISNTVHDIFDKFNELDGTPISVHSRMGISSYPSDTENFSDLIRLSDIALAQCKQSKLKISNYKREKDSHSVRKLSLLARLRGAIEDNELILVYQPKVNIQTNEVVGVEALVRWTDSEFGVVSPIEFVSWAEKSGLVDKLTHWVLMTAGTQSSEWQKLGYSIPIAVNLSPINFQDENLPGYVAALINDQQFSNGLLELEITENAVMSDPTIALDCMMQLHSLGVPFAIDDFGTGLSSFTYLRKFPVSNLKIDKEFVMGETGEERDSILLKSMIELGHNLGCVVTAEGVEDQPTLDRLREFGCDHVQGYYVCKPVPPVDLLAWMSEASWSVSKKAA